MPSKGVVDRQRIGKSIVAAARTHAARVGERLHETLAPYVPDGDTLPDPTTFQLVIASYLEDRLAHLVAADEAHLAELDDDLDPRIRRDEAAQALYDKLIRIRATLNGAFGAERVDKLMGFNGPTPRDSLTLHRQTARALDRLREPDPEFPPLELSGIQFDRNALAAELQPDVDLLAAAIADVDREQRETEITKEDKDRAIEELDRVVGAIARILTGYDRLAELESYADKIRLSLPARGGGGDELPEVPPEDAPPTDELPGPGEPRPTLGEEIVEPR